MEKYSVNLNNIIGDGKIAEMHDNWMSYLDHPMNEGGIDIVWNNSSNRIVRFAVGNYTYADGLLIVRIGDHKWKFRTPFVDSCSISVRDEIGYGGGDDHSIPPLEFLRKSISERIPYRDGIIDTIANGIYYLAKYFSYSYEKTHK